MFRKLITLALALAAALTLMVSGPTAANAAPDTTDRKATTQATSQTWREDNYLQALSQSTKARYSNAYLIRAGHYACARKDAYNLRAQIGAVRTRIVSQVARDVNRAYFSNSNLTVATNVTRATGTLGGPILSLC